VKESKNCGRNTLSDSLVAAAPTDSHDKQKPSDRRVEPNPRAEAAQLCQLKMPSHQSMRPQELHSPLWWTLARAGVCCLAVPESRLLGAVVLEQLASHLICPAYADVLSACPAIETTELALPIRLLPYQTVSVNRACHQVVLD